jgi:hypothetical protein
LNVKAFFVFRKQLKPSDYIKERKELFKDLTPEDVSKGIEEMRERFLEKLTSLLE